MNEQLSFIISVRESGSVREWGVGSGEEGERGKGESWTFLEKLLQERARTDRGVVHELLQWNPFPHLPISCIDAVKKEETGKQAKKGRNSLLSHSCKFIYD